MPQPSRPTQQNAPSHLHAGEPPGTDRDEWLMLRKGVMVNGDDFAFQDDEHRGAASPALTKRSPSAKERGSPNRRTLELRRLQNGEHLVAPSLKR